LVDSGGAATLRQLAHVFLSQDESQLLYYEKRIKEMPLKVLKRHGIIEWNGQLVSLTAPKLTLEEKAHIRMICEQKLQSFVQKRGIGIWDYRLLDEEPISDSLRFQVLKAAASRCQLCGISAKERPIDVDHIILVQEVGRPNSQTFRLCVASAIGQRGIRMTRTSDHGHSRLPIRVACFASRK
jgi:ATP adenylyltransferase